MSFPASIFGLLLPRWRWAVLAPALAALALCNAAAAGAAAARPVSTAPVAISAAASFFNLAPRDIQAAYGLPKTGPLGQRIAIISAYDDPAIQADLNAYARRFGVPPCTSANHCFQELNQSGAATPLPAPDPTGNAMWITESALGVELARGVCQSCSITLVEATSATVADLSAAANTAARAGANIIVTTFTPPETIDTAQYAADYSHPGSVVVAAAGDGGFTGSPNFPSALPSVIAVGGTALDLSDNDRYLGESAWLDTTSGCSLFTPAPVWQTTAAASVGCRARRAVVDVAAVADPGALVHIQNAGVPGGPWYGGGGTSLAAPIIAGMIGLAGGDGRAEAQRLYQRAKSQPGAFRDIRSGQTVGCTGQPICGARRGFDGPTGLGTPYGLAAFTKAGGVLDPRHPRLSLTAGHGRVHASRRWVAQITLNNENAFTVSASLSVHSARRLRFGGRLQTITFATTRLALGSLSSATASVHLAPRYRGLLRALGNVAVAARVSLRGLAGRSVTVTKRFRLYTP